MIDITGLREDKRPQSSTIVHALLDRLEAAEADALEQARLNGMGASREAALLAKLEAAEKDRANFLVEMGRLCAQCDAAERERDECNRRRLEAADHFAAQTALMKKKYDALRTELDALKAWKEEVEKQEPVGYWDPQDDMYFLPGFLLAESQAKMEPRYARPLPPAPSVPDGFSREDLEAVADGLDGYEKTVNVGNVTGEGDDHLESTTAYAARFIRTMLAAAPEAKP